MRHDPGMVYVLVSGRDPWVVKIGKTRRSPESRAEELAATPGYRYFAPYRVAVCTMTDRMSAVEAAVHRRLRPYRLRMDITGCEELFRCGERAAVEALSDVSAIAERPMVAKVWRTMGWLLLAVVIALLLA